MVMYVLVKTVWSQNLLIYQETVMIRFLSVNQIIPVIQQMHRVLSYRYDAASSLALTPINAKFNIIRIRPGKEEQDGA